MLLLTAQDEPLSLVEFNRERSHEAVIPVWLDVVYQQVKSKLAD